MRITFIFIILLISCSKSDNKKNNIDQVPIPTSINSFFNNTPSTIKLDSTYLNTIDKWISIISFSQKFNDLIDKEINHKSKISSLAVDLNKINKDNIPVEFKISPIIGRLRVLKTFILICESNFFSSPPKFEALLLDEPFSSLDPDQRNNFREFVVNNIKENKIACLLVTHDENDKIISDSKPLNLNIFQNYNWFHLRTKLCHERFCAGFFLAATIRIQRYQSPSHGQVRHGRQPQCAFERNSRRNSGSWGKCHRRRRRPGICSCRNFAKGRQYWWWRIHVSAYRRTRQNNRNRFPRNSPS